ncbi:DNA-binding transcriptional MocR family regulator [Bradyrhizobium diazoefficiens]
MPVSEEMIAGLIELKRTGEEGLMAQLTSQLRELIGSGRIGKGRGLPSSRQLASDLGVSRNTVTYAFEQLAAEGYLAASHGRRPVVTVDGGERIEAAGAATSGVRSGTPPPLSLGLKAQAGGLADVLSGAAKTVAPWAR